MKRKFFCKKANFTQPKRSVISDETFNMMVDDKQISSWQGHWAPPLVVVIPATKYTGSKKYAINEVTRRTLSKRKHAFQYKLKALSWNITTSQSKLKLEQSSNFRIYDQFYNQLTIKEKKEAWHELANSIKWRRFYLSVLIKLQTSVSNI